MVILASVRELILLTGVKLKVYYVVSPTIGLSGEIDISLIIPPFKRAPLTSRPDLCSAIMFLNYESEATSISKELVSRIY